VQKVLEDANIKLAAVASDTLGTSRRDILEAIVRCEQDPYKLGIRAGGLLKRNTDQLRAALEGR
jgi:hypothetical protein